MPSALVHTYPGGRRPGRRRRREHRSQIRGGGLRRGMECWPGLLRLSLPVRRARHRSSGVRVHISVGPQLCPQASHNSVPRPVASEDGLNIRVPSSVCGSGNVTQADDWTRTPCHVPQGAARCDGDERLDGHVRLQLSPGQGGKAERFQPKCPLPAGIKRGCPNSPPDMHLHTPPRIS